MTTCKDVMTRNPLCCLPEEGVNEVAQMMKLGNVGSIPVVEDREGQQLIGILTDRDLALKVIAAGRDPVATKVKEVMRPDPYTCLESDDVQKALDVMAHHQVRRVPVTDENRRIVGIIAQADVATRIDEPEKTGELIAEISR